MTMQAQAYGINFDPSFPSGYSCFSIPGVRCQEICSTEGAKET